MENKMLWENAQKEKVARNCWECWISLSLSGFIGGSQPTCSGAYRHLLYRDVQLQGVMYFA